MSTDPTPVYDPDEPGEPTSDPDPGVPAEEDDDE